MGSLVLESCHFFINLLRNKALREHSGLSFVPAKKDFTKGFAGKQKAKLSAIAMKISFNSQV